MDGTLVQTRLAVRIAAAACVVTLGAVSHRRGLLLMGVYGIVSSWRG